MFLLLLLRFTLSLCGASLSSQRLEIEVFFLAVFFSFCFLVGLPEAFLSFRFSVCAVFLSAARHECIKSGKHTC
jgi:hypothetical protein